MNSIQELQDKIQQLEQEKKDLLTRNLRTKNFNRLTTTWDETKDGITYHYVKENYHEGGKEANFSHNHDTSKEDFSTPAEKFEQGREYAIKHIIEVYGKETEGEFGVQNVWWSGVANWLREKAIEYIVGTIVQLAKENIVKLADWLAEQMEDTVVEGFKKLSKDDQFLLKNELKEHPRFKILLEKLEQIN